MNEAKNRFERGIENRNARLRREAESVDDRQAIREAQRRQWVNHNRDYITTGGIAMDSRTLAAKRAHEESKASAKPKPVPKATHQLGNEEICALLNDYLQHEATFYTSEFNLTNLTRFMQHNVASGKLHWTIRDIRTAAQFLAEHNYFEGAVRHRGEPAALEVPEFIPPTPQPEVKRLSIKELMEQRRTAIPVDEYRTLRNKPLAELAKEARNGMRAYNANRGGQR